MRKKIMSLVIRLLWSQRVQRLAEYLLGRRATGLINRIRNSHRMQRSIYSVWCKNIEQPQLMHLDVADRVRNWQALPLISVVMPTYNTPATLLKDAIESVLKQSYSNWELCIADDASTRDETLALLRSYASSDARIKVTFRNENGHISVASNSALALAKGAYVAFLDHDDTLAEHVLYFVAEAIAENPEANVIYSDEDKIDELGRRFDPHFKPDWNPDLLYSINYVCHLGVYRRSLLTDIGGFRAGVEGSQDYDLLLRCLPYCKPAQIVHIPRVLYHWRSWAGSTAREPEGKKYTGEAGIKALSDYFAAMGKSDVRVEAGMVANTYHVRYSVPLPEPLVSVLIPTRDRIDLLRPCLEGVLERTDYRNIEVLILDNQSCEAETEIYFQELMRRDSRVRVLRYDHPFNYSAINNFGAREAGGQIIALLNNDVDVINPDWLREMVSHALRPEIGCVGAKLYYNDDTIQHAGVVLGIGGVAGHAHKYFSRGSSGYFRRLICVQNYSAVTAACLLVRKDVFERVNGFNERDLVVAFNDVDFCLRVGELGLRNLWTPYAELYHHESKSRGQDDTPEKEIRFKSELGFMHKKWAEVLDNDKSYNLNLTLRHENFGLDLQKYK